LSTDDQSFIHIQVVYPRVLYEEDN